VELTEEAKNGKTVWMTHFICATHLMTWRNPEERERSRRGSGGVVLDICQTKQPTVNLQRTNFIDTTQIIIIMMMGLLTIIVLSFLPIFISSFSITTKYLERLTSPNVALDSSSVTSERIHLEKSLTQRMFEKLSQESPAPDKYVVLVPT